MVVRAGVKPAGSFNGLLERLDIPKAESQTPSVTVETAPRSRFTGVAAVVPSR